MHALGEAGKFTMLAELVAALRPLCNDRRCCGAETLFRAHLLTGDAPSSGLHTARTAQAAYYGCTRQKLRRARSNRTSVWKRSKDAVGIRGSLVPYGWSWRRLARRPDRKRLCRMRLQRRRKRPLIGKAQSRSVRAADFLQRSVVASTIEFGRDELIR